MLLQKWSYKFFCGGLGKKGLVCSRGNSKRKKMEKDWKFLSKRGLDAPEINFHEQFRKGSFRGTARWVNPVFKEKERHRLMAFPTQFSLTPVTSIVSTCLAKMEQFLIFLEHTLPKTEQGKKGILIGIFSIHLWYISHKTEKQLSHLFLTTSSHEVLQRGKNPDPLKKQYCFFFYWNEKN